MSGRSENAAPAAWRGVQVGERASCVLAPNPGPMTLDGTNTWVLAEPGASRAVVVDPGPLDEGHLLAVLAHVDARGAQVAQILLTHGHADHSEGARRLAGLTGAPVQALDPAHRWGGEGLSEGDVVQVDGLELHVLATPGHTWDSLSFWLPQDGAVLTGDTVLGRGTTVVSFPDGRLGAYLDSLRTLEQLAEEGGVHTVLPGHGPALHDAVRVLTDYLAHRWQRLDQVRDAVTAGAVEPQEVVRRVYAGLDPALLGAAELSVRAQLEYLREPGSQGPAGQPGGQR